MKLLDKKAKSSVNVKRFFADKWSYLLVLFFGIMITMGVWALGMKVMTGDDYAFHVTRLMSASKGWANGQIVPQVDPDTLGGFGYAYNLFYGPLLTYVVAGLKVIVGLWPVAINIALLLCIIVSGLTMCYVMRKISKNQVLAMLVAVIYMSTPYFLNNLYARMAVGEVVAMVAAPILLLGLYYLTVQNKHAARCIAISAALLILSHSLSAVLFALMAAVYVLINWRKVLNVESIWRMVLGGVVALGLTAFFTLPMLEAKLTGIYGVFDQGYAEVYFGANPRSMNDHRAWPQQLLGMDYAGKVNGDGLAGEFGITLGLMALIGLLGFWFVRRQIENEDERRFTTSLYVVAVLAILLSLPIVNWYYMPGILWQMQFPWRALMVSGLALSVVTGYTIFGLIRNLAQEKQAVIAVIVGLFAVYMIMPLILPNESKHLDGVEEVATDPVTVGWEAEYAPMQLLCSPEVEEDVREGYACSLDRVRERLDARGDGVKVIEGKVKVSEFKKDGLRVEFRAKNGDSQALVELPMIYYPGYQARLEGENLALKVTYSEEYGLVTVVIPGDVEGGIEVYYGLSRATWIGLGISVVTAGLGIVWMLFSAVRDRRSEKKDAEMVKLMDSVREVMEESEATTKRQASRKKRKKS